MKVINKNELLEALKLNLLFENQRELLDLKKYFNVISNTTGVKTEYCANCWAATKQVHNSFQMFLFKQMLNYPELLIPLEGMNGKYACEYFKNTIPILSIELLRNNLQSIEDEMNQAFKRKMDITDYKSNFDNLKEYLFKKINYFKNDGYYEIIKNKEKQIVLVDKDIPKNSTLEPIILKQKDSVLEPIKKRNRVVDKDELLKLKADGHTNTYCAEYFGVSKQAIGKLLKNI